MIFTTALAAVFWGRLVKEGPSLLGREGYCQKPRASLASALRPDGFEIPLPLC